jgi:Flp pilus assembly pilin Flp
VRRLRDRRGQTAVEFLMIAGLLTVMIVAITQIVVPTIGQVVRLLLEHMVVNLSTV